MAGQKANHKGCIQLQQQQPDGQGPAPKTFLTELLGGKVLLASKHLLFCFYSNYSDHDTPPQLHIKMGGAKTDREEALSQPFHSAQTEGFSRPLVRY